MSLELNEIMGGDHDYEEKISTFFGCVDSISDEDFFSSNTELKPISFTPFPLMLPTTTVAPSGHDTESPESGYQAF